MGPGSLGWLRFVLVVLGLVHGAYAIDPHRAMSQYIRDQWGIEKGFPGGPVYAISQTPDGYLWIGTEKGLVRFDGLSFHLIQPSDPSLAPLGPVFGLTTDNEGNLWIRLQGPNVLRYRDGKFENVLANVKQPEAGVTAMDRREGGGVLLSTLVNGTILYKAGKFETLASKNLLPKSLVISMAQTPDGRIWMGTRSAGLFYLDEKLNPILVSGVPDQKINCLLPLGNGELWIGTDNGVVRWSGTGVSMDGFPMPLPHVQTLAMARDQDSNIWLGTADGLLRINSVGVASFNKDGGSGGVVTALFEDRENNLWVGSAQGIERLRDSAFVTYSTTEGLPSPANGPVYVDAEDRTWVSPLDGGLNWLKEGAVGSVSQAGLGKDVVYSISGQGEELWIGRQRGGLTHLQYKGGTITAKTYTQAEGLAQNSVYAVHESRDGTVWAGTLSGGVSRLKGGIFTNYTTANGLVSNTVAAILEGRDGTMWFATPGGLNSWFKDQWQSYTASDGLPSENVNCLLEDSAGVLWLGTSAGLAFLDAGHIGVPKEMPETLQAEVFGIAQDKLGWLWIATSNHVLRVNRDKLFQGKLDDADVRGYGMVDGLQSVEGVKRNSTVVRDRLGRIWFSMNRGLSVIDPSRVQDDSAPAIAKIEAISADGSPIGLRGMIRVSAGHRRVTFRYTGLSLSVPERVKFRYMLEGFDRSWSEPVSAREAVYTNLGAGPYRFHVRASNSSGLWNGPEASLSFEIEPVFWQTWWFRILTVLSCVLFIVAIYRLRLHQLTRQMNVRFEERLAERTRIAQELHDTLLQGFLSASLQLHVAVEHVPPDSLARPRLARVLELMQQVIEEGRNAVRGLRSSEQGSRSLEQSFSQIKKELGIQEEVEFRVIAEGPPRPLHPVIRDEVYRIGREALVNAFRHAKASSIELELEYATHHLRMLVRDNGCGIDSQVLHSGRDGHWGLSGMRERSERIGAKLRVWSRAAAGTEVELSIPSHIAFEGRPTHFRWSRFSKKPKHEAKK